jgi:hypothetical protein
MFYYTDEWYSPNGELDCYLLTKIYETFDDIVVAQQTYRQILLKSLREPELKLYKFDCEFTQEFDAFIIEKLGASYSQFIYDTYKPPVELSDDDLLEFAYRTGWLPYVLLSFEDQPLYAIWDTSNKRYLMSSAIYHNDTPIIVGENGVDVEGNAFEIGCENRLLGITGSQLTLYGSPEELSDSPELLKQFLALPDTGIMYDAENHVIEYGQNRPPLFQQHLHTLNNLLKKPFYELHPIRPDQIKQVFENPTVKIA